jgi:hypothetical protein
MSKNNSLSKRMRVIHRYLGFFLAGIMSVYALSGIVLIFRDTRTIETTVGTNLNETQLGKALGLKKLVIEKEENGVNYFKEGTYELATGNAVYTVKELPFVLDKMAKLHKAKSAEPLFFLNIFFGVALLFFVVSSFWMFMPSSSVFKKGVLFAAIGAVLTLVLLFV